jgi:replicative DNA helicase
MDYERALISKMAQTMGVESLMAHGIETGHFDTKVHQDIYTYSVEHTKRHRTPPSFDLVRSKFPDYGFDSVPDAMTAVLEEFTKQVKRRIAIEEGRELMKAIDDPTRVGKIEEVWAESARRLMQVVPAPSISRFSEMPKRIELYRQLLRTGQLPGIAMGIPAFDQRTLGIQLHELVTIAGWQGTGKTTLGLYVTFQSYIQGKTPMIISLEMEAEALFRKFDVMATNLEYHAVKAMQLGEGDIKKWEQWAERASTAANDIIIIDDIKSCTVDAVHGSIVRYAPDITLVDYVSLMDAPKHASGSMWEKLTHITGGLKQSARTMKTPIVAIAQTNKDSYEGGADLSNISYSRSIGQDSDLVFGLHQTPDMRQNNQMEVRMLKNRDGARCEAKMHWNMARMQFREWGPSDSFGAPGA